MEIAYQLIDNSKLFLSDPYNTNLLNNQANDVIYVEGDVHWPLMQIRYRGSYDN